MTRVERSGVARAGGLLGLVVTGAALGLVAERYAVGRTRLRPDPDAKEPFFALPADRERTVLADDGVALHVEEVGPLGAPSTVVFCHGYTQSLAVWHFQRKAFSGQRKAFSGQRKAFSGQRQAFSGQRQALAAGPARLVFWDQRSHGRSGRSEPERATIDQLGHDLAAVLAATAPTGPVVLVGHSMGGMTVMALADSYPELFGPRVVGVALMSTSSGGLAQVTLGLPAVLTPVTRRALPYVTRGMRRRPQRYERTRRLGTDLAFVLARRLAFGSGDVSPSVVEFVERMTAACPVDVIAEFYDTFAGHDKLEALGVLRGLPVVVVVGSRDLMTPEAHSWAIADALPDAELVVVEGAGHMVQLEQPAVVTGALRTLLERVAP